MEVFSAQLPVKFKSAGKDVIASGVVHTYSNDNLELVLENFKLIIEFRNDPQKEQVTESQTISPTEIKLILYNFSNPLGTGLIEPIKFGTLRNRELFFAFNVYSLTTSSIKTFIYTFFLGDNAQ